MKKLLLIGLLLITLSVQSQVKDTLIATPNEAKDTLYVINDMVIAIDTAWNYSEWHEEKPVIIGVASLSPYIKQD